MILHPIFFITVNASHGPASGERSAIHYHPETHEARWEPFSQTTYSLISRIPPAVSLMEEQIAKGLFLSSTSRGWCNKRHLLARKKSAEECSIVLARSTRRRINCPPLHPNRLVSPGNPRAKRFSISSGGKRMRVSPSRWSGQSVGWYSGAVARLGAGVHRRFAAWRRCGFLMGWHRVRNPFLPGAVG